MTTLEVEVRITDTETGEHIDTDTYSVEVPDTVQPDSDGNYDCRDIFPHLFAQYPEDFPDEEPGVDAEILDISR